MIKISIYQNNKKILGGITNIEENKVKEINTSYTFYIFQDKKDRSHDIKIKFHSLLEDGWYPVGDDYE